MPCAGQGFAFLPERTHPGFGNVPKPDPNLRPRVSPSPGAFFMPDFSAGAFTAAAPGSASANFHSVARPRRSYGYACGGLGRANSQPHYLEPPRYNAPAEKPGLPA